MALASASTDSAPAPRSARRAMCVGGQPTAASVSVRRLRPEERSMAATRATTMLPAVVEPPCASTCAGELPCATSTCLQEALASQTQQVIGALDAHGAVLLRGWRISSAVEFAEAMRALPLRACTDYFPAEPGRRPLGGTGEPLEG